MVYGCEACVINRLPKKLNIYEHHEHLTSSECKKISKQLHHLPRMSCNAYVCTVCAVLATYTCISLCIIISQACHIQPSTGISTTNCPFSPFSPTLASRDSHRPLPFWPNGTVWTTHQTPRTWRMSQSGICNSSYVPNEGKKTISSQSSNSQEKVATTTTTTNSQQKGSLHPLQAPTRLCNLWLPFPRFFRFCLRPFHCLWPLALHAMTSGDPWDAGGGHKRLNHFVCPYSYPLQSCPFEESGTKLWLHWLVVEPTHLKNISQNGNLPQIGVKITNIWNHHLVTFHHTWWFEMATFQTSGCEAKKNGVLGMCMNIHLRAPALPASIIVTIGLKLGKEVFHLLTGKNTGNNYTPW